MLYIFAGLPGKGSGPGKYIHAGGLQYAIETVEELANLEHDPIVQYRRGGVFVNGTAELLYPVEYRISDALLLAGIGSQGIGPSATEELATKPWPASTTGR